MSNVLDQFRRVEQRFRDLVPARVESLRRAMEGIGYRLVGYIQTQKLSGQVLNRKSGLLSRSITQQTLQIGDDQINTKVGVFGGVPYARIHEMGGVIDIPEVSGKLMVFNSGSELVFTRHHRAFQVHMPERSYLRSSLRDLHDEIIERMNKAVGTGEVAS